MNIQEWKQAEKPFNVILHGDCMDLMAELGENEIDLAVVDPPYGIGADKKNSQNKKQSSKSATESVFYGDQKWDDFIPDEKYFKCLFRVSKNQIIWGVNYYNCFDLSGGRIYWNKNVTMPTYSDGELAYCSLINSIKSVSITWHGMIQENMKEKDIRIHPTQKPVALYRWILQNYAKAGQTIIDTHSGSGSLACACHLEKFDFIAIEKDYDYWIASVKRYEELKSQGMLF